MTGKNIQDIRPSYHDFVAFWVLQKRMFQKYLSVALSHTFFIDFAPISCHPNLENVVV